LFPGMRAKHRFSGIDVHVLLLDSCRTWWEAVKLVCKMNVIVKIGHKWIDIVY